MEIAKNTNISIDIDVILNINISDQMCDLLVKTATGEEIHIIFESVWDCRVTIENGFLDRGSKILHKEKKKSNILEIHNSDYIKYFEKQVSGTRPLQDLKDYIVFDGVDTIFEALGNKKPYVVKPVLK